MPDSSMSDCETTFDPTSRLQEVTCEDTEGLRRLQQDSREVLVLEELEVRPGSEAEHETNQRSGPEREKRTGKPMSCRSRRDGNDHTSRPGTKDELPRDIMSGTDRRAECSETRRTRQGRTLRDVTRDEEESKAPGRGHKSRRRGTDTATEKQTARICQAVPSRIHGTKHSKRQTRHGQKLERSVPDTPKYKPPKTVTERKWGVDIRFNQRITEYEVDEGSELDHATTERVSGKVAPMSSHTRWYEGKLSFGDTQIDSNHGKSKADESKRRSGKRKDTKRELSSVFDLVKKSQNTAEDEIGDKERYRMYTTWRDYEKKLETYARKLEAYEMSKRDRASMSNWWSKKGESQLHRPHEPFPPPEELTVESYKDLRDTLYTGYDADKVDPTPQRLKGWRKCYPKWAIKGRDEDEEGDRKFPPLSKDTSPLSEAFEKLMVSRADIKGETLQAPSLPEEGANWKPVSKEALKKLQVMYEEQPRLPERTETGSSVQEDEDVPYPPAGQTPHRHRSSKRHRATKTHTRPLTKTKPTKETQASRNFLSGFTNCFKRLLQVKDNVTTRSRTWQTVAPTEKDMTGATATRMTTGVEASLSYPRKGSKVTRQAVKTHKRGRPRK